MTLRARSTIIVSLLATIPFLSAAQESINDRSPLRQPRETPSGFLYATAEGSELRLLSGTSDRLLISGHGCGLYSTLSPDRKSVGLKLISGTGTQTPAVINLDDGVLKPLWPPSEQAGQVSFTRDGRCAFTVGKELIVTDGGKISRYAIGSYANLAPISPDGEHVAYNDIDDQLWVQNLSAGTRFRVTDPGYWYPLWAPDGSKLLYLSLDGHVYIIDIRSHQTVTVGEGDAPSWSPDSRFIVFSRKVIRGEKLLNADLYLASCDGNVQEQITHTDSLMETEANFTQDGSALIFRAYDRHWIYRAILPQGSTRLGSAFGVASVEISPPGDSPRGLQSPPAAPPASLTTLDIPYINQVYDTPDWFNGHSACGPTSSMMVLAYYNILPPWNSWCSWPSPGHVSPWGRYICERYYFRGHDYVATADDPSGKAGMGAFGYMWSSGSPHSTMVNYYTLHGLSAQLTDNPPYTTAVAEVNAGYPYTICVGLTSAGHIVVAHGLGPTEGTIIVNDPYGDKNQINIKGYPNYLGKTVAYDWPGYNNGYQNLATVYWAVSAHGAPPVAADTLVDDVQYGMGFSLQNDAPASMTRWRDMTRGYANHMWYTFTTAGPEDTCYAIWTPNLPSDGRYEVLAYIPISTATAARYVITHLNGTDTVVVNQKIVNNSWTSLGIYPFAAGMDGSVRLGDASDSARQAIVFDALRWSFRSTNSVETSSGPPVPASVALLQNYPNPFNPTTTIAYTVGGVRGSVPPAAGRDLASGGAGGGQGSGVSNVKLTVYDVLGREVAVLVNERKLPGSYSVEFDASALATGMYIYRLTVGQYVECRKMVLMK